MFGILAALTSISSEHQSRERSDGDHRLRTGQGLPSTKIYRESSEEKRARKELARIRSEQRLVQQVKLVRLMKKLLRQADDGNVDEELKQMAEKVRQLELKVIRIAEEKNFNADAMLDLEKPDDDDDRQLEQMIRLASVHMPDTENSTETIDEPPRKIPDKAPIPNDDQSHGDYMNIQMNPTEISSLSSDRGDFQLIDRSRKKAGPLSS